MFMQSVWMLLLPLEELLVLYMNLVSLGSLLVSRLVVKESAPATDLLQSSTISQSLISRVGEGHFLKIN